MLSGASPVALRDTARLVLCTTLAWCLLIPLFAFADWQDDARLLTQRYAYADYVLMWARGMVPWLALFPLVYRLGRSQADQPLPRILIVGLATGGLTILALMTYAVGLSLVFSTESLRDILQSVRILDWFWDTAFFYMTFGMGLQARKNRNPAPGASGQKTHIEVRSAQRIELVPITQVLGASAQGNYVCLHLQNRDILHRATLSELTEDWATHGFIRAHRSHLFHPEHVQTLKRHAGRIREVRLSNGTRIPVSVRYNASVREQLDMYFNTASLRSPQELVHSPQPR